MGSFIHKIYGGMQLIRVCRDWRPWLVEALTHPNDGAQTTYRFRNGARLTTRRNGMDLHMIDEIWCFQKYDYFGFRVQPGETVVDIGAHIGTFSVYASTACQAARVIAFEPHPDNFLLLKHNLASNHLKQTVAVNEGVAGGAGTGNLKADPRNSGGHRLSADATVDTISVPVCALRDVFDRFDIEKIDYLKMDCEGAEYDIFLNTVPETLQRISRISMEYHEFDGRRVEELVSFLSSTGFQTRLFGGHRLYARQSATI